MDDAALKEARAAIIEYAETVKTAMASVEAEVDKVGQRLTDEFPQKWRMRVRQTEAEVAKAKTAIARKRIIRAPEPASVVEETKALRKVNATLEHARAKEETARRWAVQWSREAPLYKSSVRQLSEQVHRILPEAIARLDTMLNAIEEYRKVAPPRIDGGPGPGEAGGPEARTP